MKKGFTVALLLAMISGLGCAHYDKLKHDKIMSKINGKNINEFITNYGKPINKDHPIIAPNGNEVYRFVLGAFYLGYSDIIPDTTPPEEFRVIQVPDEILYNTQKYVAIEKDKTVEFCCILDVEVNSDENIVDIVLRKDSGGARTSSRCMEIFKMLPDGSPYDPADWITSKKQRPL